MSLISAKGLTLGYGAEPVLRDIDMDIAPGEIVTLVGPNGSGKSTLARAVVGALRPRAGRIDAREGLRIGYVPQKLHIDTTMPLTVSRFLQIPHRHPRARLIEALDSTGMAGVETRQVAALSGGQLQRVLLARALLGEPQLLILDEPTQGLDQPGVASFYLLLSQIRDRTGCAVLLVSHDLHVVMRDSDRVICLNGHICCEGTPEVVSAAPAYRALFGDGSKGALALYKHHHGHHHEHHAHDGPSLEAQSAEGR